MSNPKLRAGRLADAGAALLDPSAQAWARVEAHEIGLVPSPVSLLHDVSPYIAASSGHGKIDRLEVRLAHDGELLSLRLQWRDASRDDRIDDLDRFVDAAAVMFPLAREANPITMGDADKPVNAWLWRAGAEAPFDVVAHGYATSKRRPAETSGLRSRAHYAGGAWALVMQRPLAAKHADCVQLAPGGELGIAFAAWEGANAERSGQKAVSGAFRPLELEA